MPTRRRLIAACLLALTGCTGLPWRDPVVVDVVGVDPLPGQGMELRFTVQLRVQNPNNEPIEFDGAALQLDVRGTRLGSGVSDQRGTVPRFGETVINMPVSVPFSAVIRQAFRILQAGPGGGTEYHVRGKLSGPKFGSVPFESHGKLSLPGDPFGTDGSASPPPPRQ